MLFTSPAFGIDPSSFPSSGLDAQSLGRGGTVIACPPGVWSTFGNPATLTPEGFAALNLDYLDQKDTPKKSWGLSVLDTSSSIRGSLSYFTDPEFAGLKNEMWGIAFSQTLTPSLFLGESFHMADYEPTSSQGSEESINVVDAGLLYQVGTKVSVGFVAHNLFSDNEDLLEQYNGFGIGLQFPKTIYFAADYEEDPVLTSEVNLRSGIEFNPFKKITGRLGYQDLASGDTFLTMGITYTDANGTLDAAILYNDETEKTDRIAFGLSMRM
jgi:hypothetical protein